MSKFTDLVNIPPKIVEEVFRLLKDENSDSRENISEDEKRVLIEDLFNTAYDDSSLETINANLKFCFGEFNNLKFFATIKNQIEQRPEYPPYYVSEIKSSSLMFDVIHFSQEYKILEDIAGLALSGEPWTSEESCIPIEQSTGRKYDVLKNYLNYSYSYLFKNDLIKTTDYEGKTYQIFNTGLVDKYFGYIYGVAERSGDSKFDFCFWQSSSDKKRNLVNTIFGNERPDCIVQHLCQRADPEETEKAQKELFILLPPPDNDIEKIYGGSDHLVIDNIARFPLNILGRAFFNKGNIEAILKEIKETTDFKFLIEKYKELKDILSHDESSLRTLNDDFKMALANAIKRWRWNVKTAVPIWYHEGEKIQHLLPIDFGQSSTSENVDVVAVIDTIRTDEENPYRLSTILTKRQAYIDARLLCRPCSDWLYIAKEKKYTTEKNSYEIKEGIQTGVIIVSKQDKNQHPMFVIKKEDGKTIPAFCNKKNEEEFSKYKIGSSVRFTEERANGGFAQAILLP